MVTTKGMIGKTYSISTTCRILYQQHGLKVYQENLHWYLEYLGVVDSEYNLKEPYTINGLFTAEKEKKPLLLMWHKVQMKNHILVSADRGIQFLLEKLPTLIKDPVIRKLIRDKKHDAITNWH